MKGLILLAALLAVTLGLAACKSSSKPEGPTPRPFEEVRAELIDRIDTIKVNIASVPTDIQARIKTTCRELEPYVGKKKTAQVCDPLDEALDRADPGRIDRVLADIAQLKP